ncbi:BCCT family transporter [Actinomyces sp. HMSC075C01]|uniref:BCCT family transporter n=1 Tax=Actinomyces TaxID=1654 RepID=UPI003526ACAC
MRQFVTGADSASIVMGGLSENGATDPSRFTVVFWGVATGGVASAMLLRHRWPTRSWSTRSPPRSRRPTSPMRSRPSSCTPGCRRPPATTMEMMRAPRTVPTRPPRT